MGSRVQALTLDIERDYWDRENCTEVLNLSRPDLVREIHRGYFAAGADMVETNTFGGSPLTLAEFDLADRTHEINKVAAELAREAADSFADGRHRWVVGCDRAGHQAADAWATSPTTRWRRRWRSRCARADRRRGGRHPDRDLPGHAADQGRGERRQARPRRGRHGHADLRAGDGGDHRHAAGRPRHRRRRHRDPRAGRAADRAELRHRPAGDGRARALAGRQLARPALRAAERRAAGAGGRQTHYPLAPPRWRAGWSASSPRTG